ncbi:hypothetical protein GCM10007972_26160 [Iodidimonas muriae]|uniref:Uncharacterized protein n=1 Tax=Iodidimonas muriae TaxID=261467 RepID=A0ABQ2LGF2_9PROT|nr:hypothetical protein [Iodidimonas muriae]GER08481.1 hypothetical protein JCM17843_27910 [Kordiimonadales bacterium JCM 17843]GGO16752.1 hypothetical protein GCM10007972_26160 [Iodidimonas muriae]
MRVAFHHLQCFVAKDFGNFKLAGSVYGEVAGGTVAQVMEAKIHYTSLIKGIFPGFANINRLFPIGTRENEV